MFLNYCQVRWSFSMLRSWKLCCRKKNWEQYHPDQALNICWMLISNFIFVFCACNFVLPTILHGCKPLPIFFFLTPYFLWFIWWKIVILKYVTEIDVQFILKSTFNICVSMHSCSSWVRLLLVYIKPQYIVVLLSQI